MSDISDCVVTPAEQPSVEPYLIECKFVINVDKSISGGYNEGSNKNVSHISFKGYATSELYAALMDAVRNITD